MYKRQFTEIKEDTRALSLKLEDLKIKNDLLKKIKNIENEILNLKKHIDTNYKKLLFSKLIFNKLNLIVTNSNNQINQKNAYIQNTKKRIYEDTTEIVNNIRKLKVNKMKNDLINLDFPEEKMINELNTKNNHKYIKAVSYTHLNNSI